MTTGREYEGMLAETITMKGHGGDEIIAYMARPLGAGPYPGVIVLHHMPGWDDCTKEITRKFAHYGYVGIDANLHCRAGAGAAGAVPTTMISSSAVKTPSLSTSRKILSRPAFHRSPSTVST